MLTFIYLFDSNILTFILQERFVRFYVHIIISYQKATVVFIQIQWEVYRQKQCISRNTAVSRLYSVQYMYCNARHSVLYSVHCSVHTETLKYSVHCSVHIQKHTVYRWKQWARSKILYSADAICLLQETYCRGHQSQDRNILLIQQKELQKVCRKKPVFATSFPIQYHPLTQEYQQGTLLKII